MNGIFDVENELLLFVLLLGILDGLVLTYGRHCLRANDGFDGTGVKVLRVSN